MDDEFGDLLSEYLLDADRNQAWLAKRLSVSEATISRWINNQKQPQDSATIIAILDVLTILKPDRRRALLQAAGYVVEDSPKLSPDKTEPATSSSQSSIDQVERDAQSPWSFISESISTAHSHFRRHIDWNKPPKHVSDAWEGRLLYALGRLGESISASLVFWLAMASLLWWLNLLLMGPILAWPHEDSEARRQARLLFTAALLLLPLPIALLTQPGRSSFSLDSSGTTRRRLNFLKLSGAYTGYFTFASIALALALIDYYITDQGPTGFMAWLLCGVPLLFGYVAARRIPIDRSVMSKRKLNLHDSDPIVPNIDNVDFVAISAILLFSLFLPWLLYAFYHVFADRLWGGMGIIIAVAMLAWHEMSKKKPPSAQETTADEGNNG